MPRQPRVPNSSPPWATLIHPSNRNIGACRGPVSPDLDAWEFSRCTSTASQQNSSGAISCVIPRPAMLGEGDCHFTSAGWLPAMGIGAAGRNSEDRKL